MQNENVRLAQATIVTADKLARSYVKGDDALYNRAKLVYAAVKAGQTVDAIATATSKARVRLLHPELAEDVVEVLALDTAYKVSRSVINRLGLGYRHAVDAGLVPSVATVAAAIRAISRSGTANDMSELVAHVVSLDPAQRDSVFIAGCADIVTLDNKRKGDKRNADKSANGNTDTGEITGGDKTSDTTTDTASVSVPPSLDDLLASVAELTARIASGAVVVDERVTAALDALNDAWASVPVAA